MQRVSSPLTVPPRSARAEGAPAEDARSGAARVISPPSGETTPVWAVPAAGPLHPIGFGRFA